ncbi:MAG: L-arabinose isomerase, partial [Novibacillus thermophilus]
MIALKPYEFWFVTGSQHLYGEETLQEVEAHARQVIDGLNADSSIPFPIAFKPVLTEPDAILRLCLDANRDEKCAGIVTWMHTF